MFIFAASRQAVSAVRDRLVSTVVGALPAVVVHIVLAQVDEGDTQVVNIRETDGRLGPLVFTLVALGCTSLVATIVFWWLTRAPRSSFGDVGTHTQTEGEQ